MNLTNKFASILKISIQIFKIIIESFKK
jgi:hypothetical protein